MVHLPIFVEVNIVPLTIREEPAIEVAWVKAESTERIPEAFQALEKRMESLRGQRMFGVFYVKPDGSEDYYAAVRLDNVQKDNLWLERGTIPSGLYARRIVRNYHGKPGLLPREFTALVDESRASGYVADDARPGVEYYRSYQELILMHPVLPKAEA